MVKISKGLRKAHNIMENCLKKDPMRRLKNRLTALRKAQMGDSQQDYSDDFNEFTDFREK